MEYRIRTQPDEWACTKFCRIGLDDHSPWQFILWLCDHTREQLDEHLGAYKRGEVVWYDPVESMWGFDAPRQRLAKLLWRLLCDATDEDFERHFSFATPFEWNNSADLLAPVQKRLRWVMNGLVVRREQDYQLGQTDWGEHWWLPPEQTQFVREQLKQTHAELIERSSDYEDAVVHSLSTYVIRTVMAMAVPCHDPARVYVGNRQGKNQRAYVCVRDSRGNQFPLRHGDHPYVEPDGIGFEWGYGGHGPGTLSRSILADALDGDLVLAEELDRMDSGFFETFILDHPRERRFKMTRAAVHAWLEKIGRIADYQQRRRAVADRIAAHAKVVAEKEAVVLRIQEAGGLRSQRFDIVPDTFESGLYLDLMNMLAMGGAALRCTHCGLPISYDRSGRSNKQRARSARGQPIYHPECFAAHARVRKKDYWQRRSKSAQFRESERVRARAYRRMS